MEAFENQGPLMTDSFANMILQKGFAPLVVMVRMCVTTNQWESVGLVIAPTISMPEQTADDIERYANSSTPEHQTSTQVSSLSALPPYLFLIALNQALGAFTTMSLSRATRSFVRVPVFALSTFAAQSSAPRSCLQCLRSFSTANPHWQSSKRLLQTFSVHNSSNLHPEPPPRNWGVSDTSIAGTNTDLDTSILSPTPQEQPNPHVEQEQVKYSVSGDEAQKSQPAPATKSHRLRRYNFGPRKATIKLSPSAVSHLRELLNQPEPKLIRIGTKAKGCSGLAYHLEYVDKPSVLDEQVEQDGVKVLIDNKALLNIIGSEMDWLEDKLNERFVFKNPNISEYRFCVH